MCYDIAVSSGDPMRRQQRPPWAAAIAWAAAAAAFRRSRAGAARPFRMADFVSQRLRNEAKDKCGRAGTVSRPGFPDLTPYSPEG